MTALVGLGAALALASPAAAQSRGDTGLIKWPDRVPAGSPFESSTRFGSITFPGPYASYCTADTYYPSWGADDRLYSPFMDGSATRPARSAATGHSSPSWLGR